MQLFPLALLLAPLLARPVEPAPAGASPAPPRIALREAAGVATAGAAGFRFFRADGRPLLAAANFWDGVSGDMGADSWVYELSLGGGGGGALSLRELQRVRGQGAHGADVIAVASPAGEQLLLLTVPSYYGCGSARGPAPTGPDACASTLVLRWDSAALREGGVGRGAFVELQRLATSGPAQTNHFIARDGTVFLLVGENFNDEVCLYRLVGAGGDSAAAGAGAARPRFDKHQCLPVPGGGSMAVAEAGDALLLAASSYHDNGWATRSRVFRADARAAGADVRFVEAQTVATNGAHDAELASAGGELWLFFSEDRGNGGPLVDSSLLRWSADADGFVLHQRLPGDGAHGARLFEGPDGGAAYLFVANFGDRHGERYAARSALWRQRSRGPHEPFERVAEVASFGATDAEHFVLGGRHFIALANEGDIRNRLHQRSVVYELEVLGAVGPSGDEGDGDL